MSEALDLIYGALDVFSGKKPAQSLKEADHGLQDFSTAFPGVVQQENQPGTLCVGMGDGAKTPGHNAAGVGPRG
jgi:hypothetical protein